MDRPRVVADTNVLVSGLLWIGPPHTIIKLTENKQVTLYSSLAIIEEVSHVLTRNKFIPRIERLNTTLEELIASLLNIIEIVHPLEHLSIVKNDPDDNKILECALASGANYVISGDPHLLKLKGFRNIQIITPRKFIESIPRR